MSAEQWAAHPARRRGYAGARRSTGSGTRSRRLFPFRHVMPTHQGRAAEKILFTVIGGPGKIVPNNTHFDTTRANIEFTGARGRRPGHRGGAASRRRGTRSRATWTSWRSEELLDRAGRRRPAGHGDDHQQLRRRPAGVAWPTSAAVRAVCDRYGMPLFLDACRFAENAWFIQEREAGQAGRAGRRHRPRDRRPGRRHDDERQEGRPGQHRRLAGAERRRPGRTRAATC